MIRSSTYKPLQVYDGVIHPMPPYSGDGQHMAW
jgi:hypothetical protein